MDLHDRQRVRNDRDALAATQEILGVLRLESSDRVEYPTVTGRRCASQIGSMEVAELLSSTGYSFRVAADIAEIGFRPRACVRSTRNLQQALLVYAGVERPSYSRSPPQLCRFRACARVT